MAGMFIVLEGGEGAGKTTQLRRLADGLQGHGLDVVTTREPGATTLGARLRELLLDGEVPTQRAEMLMYAADRAQHVELVIAPALAAGKVVLCDRYIGSSVAYQAAARGLDPGWVREVSLWAADGLVPDLTILLDVAPEEGLRRARGRTDANRFEAESLEFHRKVRDSFRSQARASSWERVDAGFPEQTVADWVLHLVLQFHRERSLLQA